MTAKMIQFSVKSMQFSWNHKILMCFRELSGFQRIILFSKMQPFWMWFCFQLQTFKDFIQWSCVILSQINRLQIICTHHCWSQLNPWYSIHLFGSILWNSLPACSKTTRWMVKNHMFFMHVHRESDDVKTEKEIWNSKLLILLILCNLDESINLSDLSSEEFCSFLLSQ